MAFKNADAAVMTNDNKYHDSISFCPSIKKR